MFDHVTGPTATTIGFIGLGNMGRPMATHLVDAGYQLTVFDIDGAVADAVALRGATRADSAAGAADGIDVLITMLPGPAQIDQVMNTDGAADALSPGAIWIDMSTSIPSAATTAVARITANGGHCVDAPVSGMAHGARAAQLQIFCGCTPELFEHILPVLQVLGDPERILHVGGKGTGYTVKLMINQLWFAHLTATAEILAIGTTAGVDLGVLRTSLINSPARSDFLENDVDRILGHGDYDESFTLALACKDSRLAVDLARDTGIPAGLLTVVDQVFEQARARYGDDAGEMRPFQLYEDEAGRALRYESAAGGSSAR